MKMIKPFILGILIAITACQNNSHKGQQNQVKLLLDAKAKLGEGAIWHPVENRLYWIDIEKGELNIYDPAIKVNKIIGLGQKIGTVVPIDTGCVVVALKNGIFTFNERTEALKMKCSPEDTVPGNRFNDGKCCPAGRFWVGSMSLSGEKKAGKLYKIEADFSYSPVIEDVTVSNGICWSKDGKKMYYIDTPKKNVVAYDYNKETGEISNPREVIQIPDGLGYPDGSTMDEKGNIWIAMWGGKCIINWNLKNGEMIEKIDVPAKNVTSVAFGGHTLDTLYITTASVGMKNKDVETFPHAGGLFYCVPGVKGVKAQFFKSK